MQKFGEALSNARLGLKVLLHTRLKYLYIQKNLCDSNKILLNGWFIMFMDRSRSPASTPTHPPRV